MSERHQERWCPQAESAYEGARGVLVVMIAVAAGAFVLLTVAARHRMRPAREPEISPWHDGLDALDRIDRRRVRR